MNAEYGRQAHQVQQRWVMEPTFKAANKRPVQLGPLGELGNRETSALTVVSDRLAQYTQGMGTALVPLGHE